MFRKILYTLISVALGISGFKCCTDFTLPWFGIFVGSYSLLVISASIELIRVIVDTIRVNALRRRKNRENRKLLKKFQKNTFDIDVIPIPNTTDFRQESFNKYMAILNGINENFEDIKLTYEN